MKRLVSPKPWLAPIAVAVLPAAALAQSPQGVPQAANQLYSDAAAAMIKKDYATACPKFAEVTRLVPDGGGVRLNLAECYEEAGKLASAYTQYGIAETLAVKDGRKDRQKAAASGAARVKPKLAMLIIDVPQSVRSAPDLLIKLDGDVLPEKVWGVPYPVDRGPHELIATAKGREPVTVKLEVAADGTRTSTAIPPLPPAKAPPESSSTLAVSGSAPPGPVVIVKEEGVFTTQIRTAAVIGGGALTLGGIVAGSVLMSVAAAKDSELRNAMLDPNGRDAALSAAGAKADMQNAAIGSFVGAGVAAAGTAVFYLLTRPKAKPPVTAGAFVTPEGASLWVEGVTW